MNVGIDVGTRVIKMATEQTVTARPSPAEDPRAAIRAVLANAGPPRDGLCIALPDVALSGKASATRLREDLRHECEDVSGTVPVTWTGQLAAVAAFAARDREADGTHLVCDLGGAGVRAGLFSVTGGTVTLKSVRAAEGSGWDDFDAALRATLPGHGPRLPTDWPRQAAAQGRRPGLVLNDAVTAPENFGAARAYRISGPDGDVSLTAAQVITGFAPVLRHLRAVIEQVLEEGDPDQVTLTGGLGWLPLAARAVSDITGAEPEVAGPATAARGALLFALGQARLASPDPCPLVTVPAHRVHEGLLEEVSVSVPWTESFAPLPGGDLTIDAAHLDLTIDGRPHVAPLPGLVPGPHRIGARPAWPGPGALVIRASAGGLVHVVPLAGLAAG